MASIADTIRRRGAKQFGEYLSANQRESCGIGPVLRLDDGPVPPMIYPTKTFTGNASFIAGGVRFELYEAPGETHDQMRETADYVARLPIDGVKLHLLYIVKGTRLDERYQSGQYRCLERDEYIDLVCDVLERLPEKMVIQRLTGDPHRHELVAPLWALEKNENVALIQQRLAERDTWQGKRYGGG